MYLWLNLLGVPKQWDDDVEPWGNPQTPSLRTLKFIIYL